MKIQLYLNSGTGRPAATASSTAMAGRPDELQSPDAQRRDKRHHHGDMEMTQETSINPAKPVANRWLQLIMGIVCMAMIANLQYGWTLFVNPIADKYHWSKAAIQVAFTIFVLTETWLVPIEGWAVDKFGPRPVVLFGGLLCALGWVMNSFADTLTMLYIAAADLRYRRRRGVRHLRRFGPEMVPGSPRPGSGLDRGRFRRRLGGDHHPDLEDDRRAATSRPSCTSVSARA